MAVNEKEIALKFLIKQEQELMAQLKGIRSTIVSLGGQQSIQNDPILEEDSKNIDTSNKAKEFKNLSQSDLFLTTLKEHNRFMHVREIGEYVGSILKDGKNWKTLLSRRTRSLQEKGYIVSKQIGTTKLNYFWGSPKWLDENGEIKPEYMYDKNAVVKKTAKSPSILF